MLMLIKKEKTWKIFLTEKNKFIYDILYMNLEYKDRYLKYKKKYFYLKKQIAGSGSSYKIDPCDTNQEVQMKEINKKCKFSSQGAPNENKAYSNCVISEAVSCQRKKDQGHKTDFVKRHEELELVKKRARDSKKKKRRAKYESLSSEEKHEIIEKGIKKGCEVQCKTVCSSGHYPTEEDINELKELVDLANEVIR